MNPGQYNKWIKSHQSQTGQGNVADVVMSRITQQADKPGLLEKTWEMVLLDLIQIRTWVRMCVLISGAGIGILRMFMQIYSVLFT